MKVKIKLTVKKNACFLKVSAGIRYWGSTRVNGFEEESEYEDATIPCRENGRWKPIINIDNGRIENWAMGYAAEVHYKVRDDFKCEVCDENLESFFDYDGYVPEIMCPVDDGYGDYIIMEIDKNGFIADWDKEKIHKLLEMEED